jgi:pimeloyl-ACP methyl ester carboxylesterase
MAQQPSSATRCARIEVAGANVAYSDTGGSEPVVMSHCSGACRHQWAPLGETLGARFRTVAPDQWGCGESDPWPGHAPFTLADEAAPLLGIIDAIDGPAHLLGHSYGGAVALRAACERPDALRSLTLIEPSLFHLLRQGGLADKDRFYEIATVSAAVNDAVLSGDRRRGAAQFVDYWNGPGAWDRTSEKARAKLCARLPTVALDFRALFDEETELAAYRRIGVPTLLLRGENSPAPSRRIVEMLAAILPRARVEVIPGAGHMSPFSHANAVNAAIRRHLDGASAARDRAA